MNGWNRAAISTNCQAKATSEPAKPRDRAAAPGHSLTPGRNCRFPAFSTASGLSRTRSLANDTIGRCVEDGRGGNRAHEGARSIRSHQRVKLARGCEQGRLAPDVWLLCERDRGLTPRTQYYLVNLPTTASLRALVRVAHQRWAIEQQYQELKDEIGFDHVEGRTMPAGNATSW